MSKEKQINALHKDAMEIAGQAFKADIHGDFEKAQSLFEKAFELERQAALMLVDDLDAEPTRSVLLRSAATLGIDCKEYREAERLVAIGLAGNPPNGVAEELRDVLEKIYFSRHLSLRGIELDPSEFQMSLTGDAIGLGIAESGVYLRRANSLEKSIVRTAERLRGMPFRVSGSPNRNAMRDFRVFYSAARPASFALSIRLGRPERQLILPGPDFVSPKNVVDEFMSCMRHFNSEEVDALQERIQDESYFNNFTALARTLAPDGRQITTVGFTSIRGEETQKVALTHPAGSSWSVSPDGSKPIRVTGTIRSADESTRRREHPVFGVEEDNGNKHTISVPPGILQDIVKPFWGERVHVVARRSGSRFELSHLEPIDETETDQANETNEANG